MLIYEGNLHKKDWSDISIRGRAEKITFTPKRGWQTDRRTDICFYRVALLLKSVIGLTSFVSILSQGDIVQKYTKFYLDCIDLYQTKKS